MIARERRSSVLAVLVVIAASALGMTIGAAGAQAAGDAPCRLSVRDQEPPGGTSAYDLTLSRKGTSCATAVKIMKAFHRCRTEAGSGCTRTVLASWRCRGRRDASRPTSHGTFTCSSGARRVRSGYRQEARSCFGAAARDPKRPCFNPTRSLTPPLGDPDPDMSWVCDPGVVPGACVFGAPPATATGHFALVGDSHTQHWRAALSVVAEAEGWRGYSIATGGCFFSEAVDRFDEGCLPWYRGALAWFDDHPEVRTVFVTQNADTPVAVPEGQTSDAVKVDGFRRAWQKLPRSVEHVVVLRDTTISSLSTFECLQRVTAAAMQRLATACPLSRSVAVRDDLAVTAARELRSPRYASIDLTDFMCSRRNCYPVVGGTLVNGDIWGHLNTTFARTLGPYLLREIRRLMARW